MAKTMDRSLAEGAAAGEALRKTVPRRSTGEWTAADDRPDPIAILEASNVGRVEQLVPIRFGRMMQSPFAFYRGSAAVMATDLAQSPTSGLTVQACGDCHLLNFGIFATPERNVVFGLNDFDETLRGPWEWDLKRLAASLVLAGRDIRLTERDAVAAAVAAVAAYRRRMWELASLSPLDVWYDKIDAQSAIDEAPDKAARKRRQQIEAQARRRVGDSLIPKLVRPDGDHLHIVDQPPLLFHEPGTMDLAEPFIASYRQSLPDDRRVLLDRYRLEDVAVKVVGVGSVGTRCLVALFSTPSGHPLFLQIKEANTSVLAPHVGGYEGHNGQRVVVGQRLLQPASDIFLGWATGPGGRDFYIRQLRDMKLSVTLMGGATEMLRYGEFCGLALARGHANTGDAAAIAGYLGQTNQFDLAIGRFAAAYADQTVLDHRLLIDAVNEGRVEAIEETL
jgi:uncharacterized protein (DUF2252 family)